MEKIQAGLRGVIRTLTFICFAVVYLTVGYIIHFTTKDEVTRRRRFMRNGRIANSLVVWCFGIKIQAINVPKFDEKLLIVSNHMGFIDILSLSALLPSLFITSQEMRETPVLGLITEMAGCIYVERRSRMKTLDEMKSVARILNQGFRVVLYAEATSTNGEKILPFKRTLMMAAEQAGVAIQPLVINFIAINGEKFTLKWRDHVCWYGDIGFGTAAWRALTLKSIVIRLEFLERIYPKADDDRAKIAVLAHDAIAAKFMPVIMTHEGIPADLNVGLS